MDRLIYAEEWQCKSIGASETDKHEVGPFVMDAVLTNLSIAAGGAGSANLRYSVYARRDGSDYFYVNDVLSTSDMFDAALVGGRIATYIPIPKGTTLFVRAKADAAAQQQTLFIGISAPHPSREAVRDFVEGMATAATRGR